jgi:hypothetical protein
MEAKSALVAPEVVAGPPATELDSPPAMQAPTAVARRKEAPSNAAPPEAIEFVEPPSIDELSAREAMPAAIVFKMPPAMTAFDADAVKMSDPMLPP